MYDITSYTNMTSFLTGVNGVTEGWFWSLMLLGIGITIFIMVSQRTTGERAFLTSGFTLWAVGTFFFVLQWINFTIWLISMLTFISGIVWSIVRGDKEI